MSLLYGENEALDRLRGQMKQRNTGGIMYPSGTNGRGMPGGREPHAAGDRVGGLPSEGGSRMRPMHGGNHGMGGVETKNKRNAVQQQRSAHAEGGQPRPMAGRGKPQRCYEDGDVVEKKLGGLARGLSHTGRNINRSFSMRPEAINKEDREHHKFGAGIGSDFKNLGRDIKKGWKKEIGDPFKNKITDPTKRGLDKGGEKLRQTGSIAKKYGKAGAQEVHKAARTTGRAIRDEYREASRD